MFRAELDLVHQELIGLLWFAITVIMIDRLSRPCQ